MTDPLRLATWNIHSSIGSDGLFDPHRTAGIIKDMDTQLLALQEIDNGYRLREEHDVQGILTKGTGMHFIAGPTLFDDNGFFGNGILTRLPLVDIQRYDISVDPAEPRGVIVTTLQWGRQQIHFIATHLGLRRKERLQQAHVISDIIRAHTGPLLLAGDFNDWIPGSPLMRHFMPPLFQAKKHRTWPARLPLFPLDRILFSWHWNIQWCRPVKSRDIRKASDHLPLLAQLSMYEPDEP